MHTIAFILALIWTVPAIVRTWRLARFYQIEEYNTQRFLRWLFEKRDRRVPYHPTLAMLVGIIISAALQLLDVDTVALHVALWVFIAGIVAYPEPVKETKKQFVRTQRAMRLLITAFLVNLFLVIGLSLFLTRNMEANTPQELSTVGIVGFIGFFLSPFTLPAANLLMYPVEAMLRAGFRRKALQRLHTVNPVVIGITGSYGKTSTKHYLTHVLGGRYRVYATPKSYNTEMGICLAINNDLDPQYGYEYFIAEMGAYIPGEIKRIVELTKPQMSIVTAVGPMHLERFKTLENVVIAKYEIIEGLPPDGTAFFNGDNAYVRGMAERGYPQKRVLISQEGLPEARLVAENIQQSLKGISFEVLDRETGDRHPFNAPVFGLHNITNILLAAAVARHIGLSLAEIGMRVATLQPSEHRLNVNQLAGGITVIDDAYSANPVGAASALEVLRLYEGGRRVVITPGMVELGAVQDAENQKLGQRIADVATDVVLVGIQQTQPIQRGVKEAGFPADHLMVVDTFDEARQWFQTHVQAGDAVLFLNDLPDTYL